MIIQLPWKNDGTNILIYFKFQITELKLRIQIFMLNE